MVWSEQPAGVVLDADEALDLRSLLKELRATLPRRSETLYQRATDAIYRLGA